VHAVGSVLSPSLTALGSYCWDDPADPAWPDCESAAGSVYGSTLVACLLACLLLAHIL